MVSRGWARPRLLLQNLSSRQTTSRDPETLASGMHKARLDSGPSCYPTFPEDHLAGPRNSSQWHAQRQDGPGPLHDPCLPNRPRCRSQELQPEVWVGQARTRLLPCPHGSSLPLQDLETPAYDKHTCSLTTAIGDPPTHTEPSIAVDLQLPHLPPEPWTTVD